MNFDEFRNYHAGRPALVCGLGASLNLVKPETLATILTIGCNDIGRKITPTYLVNVNLRSQYKQDRFQWIEKTGAKAIFTQMPKEQGNATAPIVKFGLGQSRGLEVIEGKVPHFLTTPYMSVVLAAYFGCNSIGMIGVDLTTSYFWVENGPQHRLSYSLKELDIAFGRLHHHLQLKNVELLNLSPTSALKSLPREDVNAWLNRSTLS